MKRKTSEIAGMALGAVAAIPFAVWGFVLGGMFIGAATGGENETHWIDNVQIATTTGLVPVPLGFSFSSGKLTLTWDAAGFKLQSTPTVQPTTWSDVPGATSPYLVPLTGAHAFYRLAAQ